MPQPKTGTSSHGNLMHYSVGAVIQKDGKYLLIDRTKPPLGFAGLAGHIDKGETPEQAIDREVREESGYKVASRKLLYSEELEWNWCAKGIPVHYWNLFECAITGAMKRNAHETKSIGWYTQKEIKKLTLEPVWEYWFRKLKII